MTKEKEDMILTRLDVICSLLTKDLENKSIIEKKLIEAYMLWESEHKRGDIEGKRYFNGGLDAIIMIAQMLGCSDEFIKKEMIG